MHAGSDLTLLCYCSAAAKSRSACTDLPFGRGLPTERVHTQLDLKLPRYSSAPTKFRFACIEPLSGPGLSTERVYARFGLKLPRHRSAAAKSRFVWHGTARSAAGSANHKLFRNYVGGV